MQPAPTTDARVEIAFLGHATVRLELDGATVVTDPLLRRTLGPLQRHGPLPSPASLADADIVLVSHGHPDHFDPRSLRALPDPRLVIVPRGLGRETAKHVRAEVVELEAGEAVRAGPLRVRAVPAKHWILPGAPRAEPLGYLVEGSATIYVAGDTGRQAATAALVDLVDLALLPVWTWGPHLGPGHLGPRAAAEVLAQLRAHAAVPVHWGTLYPRRLHHVLRRPLDEPGDRFARHAASLAPGAQVRVLRPGETWSLRLPARRDR